MSEFKKNSYAYTKQGVEVYIEEVLGDDKYLVTPVMYEDVMDQYQHTEEYEFFGTPFVATKLLKNKLTMRQYPSVLAVEAEIKSARAILSEVNGQVSEARASVTVLHKDYDAIMRKMSVVPALKHIKDLVEGKIEFYVTSNGGNYNIVRHDEMFDEEGHKMSPRTQLLTLYGDMEGDIQWGVGRYTTDYGAHTYYWPCKSYDAAVKLIGEKCTVKIEKWVESGKTTGIIHGTITAMRKFDIELPASVVQALEGEKQLVEDRQAKKTAADVAGWIRQAADAGIKLTIDESETTL